MAIKRIPLYTCLLNGQPADTVSARDLHTFLQLDCDFFHWVKSSRTKLYFVKERYFILVDNLIRPMSDVNASAQKTKDYFISLDMVYEIAMEEEGDLVQQADLDQALGKTTKSMAPDEDLLVLPIHQVSKTIETSSLYRDKVFELHGLSVWMEQHITNLNAYINHQFLGGQKGC